jgi:hypothetical protein
MHCYDFLRRPLDRLSGYLPSPDSVTQHPPNGVATQGLEADGLVVGAQRPLRGRRCSVKVAKRIAVAIGSLLTLVLAGGAHIKL